MNWLNGNTTSSRKLPCYFFMLIIAVLIISVNFVYFIKIYTGSESYFVKQQLIYYKTFTTYYGSSVKTNETEPNEPPLNTTKQPTCSMIPPNLGNLVLFSTSILY